MFLCREKESIDKKHKDKKSFYVFMSRKRKFRQKNTKTKKFLCFYVEKKKV